MIHAIPRLMPSVNAYASQNTDSRQAVRPVTVLPRQDEVLFAGRNDLFRKYGLDPKTIRVETPPGVTLKNKAMILGKLLETYEHALKNQALGNYSNRHFSSSIQMENGAWGMATNIENSRDIGILCGERSALVNAWNTALKKLNLDNLKKTEELAKAQQGMRVKMIVMSGSNNMSPNPSVEGSPCSECQSWMATDKYFSPETLIVSLKRDVPNGELYLKVRKLGELLPLNGKTVPSLTRKSVEQLPVQFSPRAQEVLASNVVSQRQLQETMAQARQAYESNQTAEFSGKNTAAAVLFSTGDIRVGKRFDWTARWFETPDLTTAARGIQELLENPLHHLPAPRVTAVAYYGDNPQVPSVMSLGVLAQKAWGSPDVLIAVVENDTLKVRTLRDYMTDIYISDFKPKGK